MTRAALAELIPHQGDMCLLDGVEAWNDEEIVCQSQSHRHIHNPLRSHGRLHVLCGIEYAAQAMAVHGALLAARQGRRLGPGMLASARDVQWHRDRLDDLPALLRIRAQRLMCDARGLLYAFRIESEDECILEGRCAVFLSEEKT